MSRMPNLSACAMNARLFFWYAQIWSNGQNAAYYDSRSKNCVYETCIDSLNRMSGESRQRAERDYFAKR